MNILLVAVSLTIPVMLHLTNVNSKHHTNPLQSPIMLHLTNVYRTHHTKPLRSPIMLHLTNVNSKHHTNPLQSPIMLHLTKVNSKHHTTAKQKLNFLHKTMPYNHNPYAHFSGCGVVWRGAWGEEEWIKQVQHCIVRNVTKRAHRIHLHCCGREISKFWAASHSRQERKKKEKEKEKENPTIPLFSLLVWGSPMTLK